MHTKPPLVGGSNTGQPVVCITRVETKNDFHHAATDSGLLTMHALI